MRGSHAGRAREESDHSRAWARVSIKPSASGPFAAASSRPPQTRPPQTRSRKSALPSQADLARMFNRCASSSPHSRSWLCSLDSGPASRRRAARKSSTRAASGNRRRRPGSRWSGRLAAPRASCALRRPRPQRASSGSLPGRSSRRPRCGFRARSSSAAIWLIRLRGCLALRARWNLRCGCESRARFRRPCAAGGSVSFDAAWARGSPHAGG